MRHHARLALAGLVPLLTSLPAWAQEPPKIEWAAPTRWFAYGVIVAVLLGTVVALMMIRTALVQSHWSLGDAISEGTEVAAMARNAQGDLEPKLDGTGKPIMVTEMRASSSRLIALMGMMGILLMFMGFGAFSLYAFALKGTMSPQIDKVVYFLLSGMTLFAPYVVNKFASVFEAFAKR